MNLSQLQALMETIEQKNLTRAAEKLGYTQSGITHLLNALEEECGLKLLVRERAGTYATAEGELLLPYFREVIGAYQDLDEKLNEIRRLNAGLIRIATFNTVSVQWLPAMIAGFVQEHPGMEFQLLHGSAEENTAMLENGKVDISFETTLDEKQAPDRIMHRDPLMAVLPENHELAGKKAIRVEELANYPFIKLNEDALNTVAEIGTVLAAHRVRPQVRFSEINDYAVAAMVEQGLGVSILPLMSVDRTSRHLAIRPLASGEKRIIGINMKDPGRLSKAALAFITYAENWVVEKYGRSGTK